MSFVTIISLFSTVNRPEILKFKLLITLCLKPRTNFEVIFQISTPPLLLISDWNWAIVIESFNDHQPTYLSIQTITVSTFRKRLVLSSHNFHHPSTQRRSANFGTFIHIKEVLKGRFSMINCRVHRGFRFHEVVSVLPSRSLTLDAWATTATQRVAGQTWVPPSKIAFWLVRVRGYP